MSLILITCLKVSQWNNLKRTLLSISDWGRGKLFSVHDLELGNNIK